MKEGKAVVGWVKVGEAGVQKARAGALFCGVPWVFMFKLFVLRVLFCFKPEKRVPPSTTLRSSEQMTTILKKWVVRHQSQRGVVVAQQA